MTNLGHAASPDALVQPRKGKAYWETIDADANGMLGGILAIMPSVSRIDIQGSKTFLARLGIGIKSGRKVVPRALEGGAGIGRITEALLTNLAEQVDVIEPVAKFTTALQGKPGVGEVFNIGLEEWHPTDGVLYDLIWIQWCVGYLGDESLVRFFEHCKTALNPDGGIIVVKENISASGADIFHEVDSSVTREDSKFRQIFEQAGLQLIRTDLQLGFPEVGNRQLLPLRMYALKP